MFSRSFICSVLVAFAGMPSCGHQSAASAAPPTPGVTQTGAPAAQPSSPPASSTERQLGPMPSLAPLVKELRPAVINISTTQNAHPRRGHGRGPDSENPEDFFEHFFGGSRPQMEQKRQALGSGFLIGGGLALTNNHVIEGADEIKARLADGRTFDAKVIGADPTVDVAVLKLSGDAATTTSSVKLGDSDAIDVGDYVVAIGNPFGLALTVTSGIVSAKERNIGAGPYDDFIQTDASINPGNSGGPLFNLKGEVIGINTAIVAQGQGIGFAVPINMVKDLLPQLEQKGKVSRGWLGVGIQEVTPELAQAFNLQGAKGALISKMYPGSPAAKAGLQNGDIITEFNGHKVDSPGALSRAVAATAPGSSAPVKFLRDGKERTAEVKLTERTEELASGEGGEEGGGQESNGAASTVGLHVAPIPEELAQRLHTARGEGLLVTSVDDGSAADNAGVQPNDVLVELQRKPMASVDAFQKVASAVKPGDTVLFRVKRGGSALYLAARAPQK